MENTKRGVFFNECDITKIIEKYLGWAEVEGDQIFCAEQVMSDCTPIGTSIMVGVDGIKCDQDSSILRLSISSGIYELNVKTVEKNDAMNVRFDTTIPIPGTYGEMVDGALNILTDEEIDFKKTVEDLLGERTDEYAEMFRTDNMRNIGGRGLRLLEKIKAEIKQNDVLVSSKVTPIELVATFIEITDKYVCTSKDLEELKVEYDIVVAEYDEADGTEENKRTKKLSNDVNTLKNRIASDEKIIDFCHSVIEAAVLPVLNTELER